MARSKQRKRELARAKWERRQARRGQQRRRRQVAIVVVAGLAVIALVLAMSPWSPAGAVTGGVSPGSDDARPAVPVTIDDIAVVGT